MTDKINLSLWEQAQRTDPAYTKTATLGGRAVTSINGTYMVKRATELLGKLGIGWGYEIVEERFDNGVPILNKEGGLICNAVMHTIKLRLWYIQDGQRGEVTQYGHTPYIQSTKFGPNTDFDAPKKSLTDAIKKSLSMIGFSADIFMGLYDDMNYVEAERLRSKIEAADSADDETMRQRTEFGEWANKELAMYPMIPNKSALRLMHQGHMNKLHRQCQLLGINPESAKQRFTDAYNKQLEALAPKIVEVTCTECGTANDGEPDKPCKECGSKTIVTS